MALVNMHELLWNLNALGITSSYSLLQMVFVGLASLTGTLKITQINSSLCTVIYECGAMTVNYFETN